MACAGDRRAGRSADLFGDRHRDRPRASPGVPPAAASDRGLLRSIADRARDRYRHPGSYDAQPSRRRPDDLAEANRS